MNILLFFNAFALSQKTHAPKYMTTSQTILKGHAEIHEIPTEGTHNTFDRIQCTEIEASLIPKFQKKGGKKTRHDRHEESEDFKTEYFMLSSSWSRIVHTSRRQGRRTQTQ